MLRFRGVHWCLHVKPGEKPEPTFSACFRSQVLTMKCYCLSRQRRGNTYFCLETSCLSHCWVCSVLLSLTWNHAVKKNLTPQPVWMRAHIQHLTLDGHHMWPSEPVAKLFMIPLWFFDFPFSHRGVECRMDPPFCRAIFPSFHCLLFFWHIVLRGALLNVKDWPWGISLYLLKSMAFFFFFWKLDIPFWLDGFSYQEVHSSCISSRCGLWLRRMCPLGVTLLMCSWIFLLRRMHPHEPHHLERLKMQFKSWRTSAFLLQMRKLRPRVK